MADNWLDQYPEASPLDVALAHEGADGDVADIARSIYTQESSSGKNAKTSNAGAVGGMQVTPGTFKRVADKDWDITDPVDNARAGVRYIKALHERGGGDPALTAAGYYGGEGAQDKARVGVAVKDPRNPKAPDTLQYAQAVVSRLPKAAGAPAAAAPAADDWLKQFPEATAAEVASAAKPAAAAPAPTAAPAAPPRRSTLDELGRQLGLTARAAVQGVASLPAIASDAVTGVVNKGLDAVEGEGNGFRFQRAQEALGNLMDKAGVPKPENATERVVQDVGSAMTGAGTAAKAGQVLAKAASPVAAAVGEKLAEGAGMQVASGAAGGGASGVTREKGGGAGAQLAAGVVGSLAPSGVPFARNAAIRGVLRGGEAGRQTVADNIESFAAAGTTPTVGQATEGRVARATESLLAKTPGSAGVIAKRSQQQADEMATAVQQISDTLAPDASAANAGEAIERGVKQFKNNFKEQQRTVYNELDQHIPPDTRIPVDNTQTALAALNEDIAGSPALSKWFKNARIQGIEGGLNSDALGADAVLSRPGMQEHVDQMRANLQDQARRAAQANAERRTLGMNNLEEVLTPAQIEDQVQGFLGTQVDNRLSYQALKKLRTLVGQELSDGGLAADVPRSKWSALYGAISQDLGKAAEEAGPRAVQVWKRANDFTRLSMERLDQLSKVVSRDAPEKVFTAAISGTNEGATTVTRVMKALPLQERNQVAAAVLQRLGRATAGQQNAAGDSFSAETFLTNLSKMSQPARQSIFGRTSNKDLIERVQQLAKVSESRRDGGRVFANPSGTAPAMAQNALLGSGGVGAAMLGLTGNPLPLATAIATPVAANALAKKMTSPEFVKGLAEKSTLAPGGAASMVEAAGRANPDAAAAPQLDWLKQFPPANAADQGAAPAAAAGGGAAQPQAPVAPAQAAPLADPERFKARVQTLRDAGENDMADALDKRQQQADLQQSADQEVHSFSQSSHPLFQMPEFAESYRALRQEGRSPGEAAGRSAVSVAFSTLGKQSGLSDKMLKAGLDAAAGKPVAEVPAMLEKYVTALAKAGAVPADAPAKLAEAVHGAWQDAVDVTLRHVYPEQQEPASGPAQADVAAAPGGEQVAQAAAADQSAAQDGAPQRDDAAGLPAGGADAVRAGTAPAADVAGADSQFHAEPRPDGTLALKGDPQAISQTLAAAGIPAASMIVAPDGVVVGRSQVPKLQQAIERIHAAADLDAKAHEAATSPQNDKPEPTEAQKVAGNYAKGHVRLHGMDITIENPQGSVRRGVAPDGTPWENELASHYGYVRSSRGNDGDNVDVFIGPDPHSERVFVVDQLHPDGSFDEHKAMLGFHTEDEAVQGYLANYDAGHEQNIGAVTELPVAAFKSWVHDGVKKKPLGQIPDREAEARAHQAAAEEQAIAERMQQRHSTLASMRQGLSAPAVAA